MIVVKNVTKKFGQKVALEEISFEVNKGEIFGFLGPSGSGKTTMIKILTGQLNADSGQTEWQCQEFCVNSTSCQSSYQSNNVCFS